MEGSEGSPPQSLCMILAAELYPKPLMEKGDINLTVPFPELPGESVKFLGRTGDGVLALSNYRLFLLKYSNASETSVPLSLIESIQLRDLFQLIINCKDASTVKCSFETAEQCSEWQRRLQLSIGVPETLESLFAFPFYSWTCEATTGTNVATTINNINKSNLSNALTENNSLITLTADCAERLQRVSRYEDDFMHEVDRLGFDLSSSWRITCVNEDFKLCPSYPKKILVPFCIPDEMLHGVANFRGSRRLPAVVWRHKKSGAVIARCSQPEVGWLGWRNAKDEQLLKALADACAFDRGEQQRRLNTTNINATSTVPIIPSNSPTNSESSHEDIPLDEVKKVLIVDARSYTSAVTNRARGGGCECIEYYPFAEIEFMNLGNIHVIRKSFHALRQLYASPPDIPNWLGLLEKTMWLQHLSGLLAASMTVCHAIEKEGRPVLVHCSDGWDRTPQIVATAQLCLDPYYRTVEGFRILVEREWLSYGHKFADRCGHGPGSDELNERCPVFLQWLDLIHQIHKQFSCSFEFSMGYLIKLAQHSLSCLFGTFLCNTLKERIENSIFDRTFSVWAFLSGPMYRNPLYVANKEKVIWPAHNVRDLYLWTEVYLGSLGNKNGIEYSSCIHIEGLNGSISSMGKTRSYGDLISADIYQNGMSRRSSDPNMSVDPNSIVSSESENNSIVDDMDIEQKNIIMTTDFIIDTTKKLNDLTSELNNHDNHFVDKEYKEHIEIAYNDIIANDKKQTELVMSNNYNITLEKLQIDEKTSLSTIAAGTDSLVATSSSSLATTLDSSCLSSRNIKINDVHTNIDCDNNEITSPKTISTSPSSSSLINSSTLLTPKTRNEFCKDKKFEVETVLTDYTNVYNINNSMKDSIPMTMATNNSNENELMHSINFVCGNSDKVHKSVKSYNPLLFYLETTNESTDVKPNDLNKKSNYIDIQMENLWHGSVNTSTDTLVPIDMVESRNNDVTDNYDSRSFDNSTEVFSTDSEEKSTMNTLLHIHYNNCEILPKVHCSVNNLNRQFCSSNTTCTDSDTTTTTCNSPASSLLSTNQNQILTSSILQSTPTATPNKPLLIMEKNNDESNNIENCNGDMNESIMILPEYKKLEISVSGKCEKILNENITPITNTSISFPPPPFFITNTSSATIMNRNTNTDANVISTSGMNTNIIHRRRTSSSNSRFDGFPINKQQQQQQQQNNQQFKIASTNVSRISLPNARSLPITPSGLIERPQIAISCPDGLSHALSEQNIRLQQIVLEHKVREDVLLREIHDMRMALLKKTCPNCNNVPVSNEEQFDEFSQLSYIGELLRRHYCNSHIMNCDDGLDDNNQYENNNCCSILQSPFSGIDNMENSSICSWEAVEDRSGQSSSASSSIQPSATSVLWVPDHAVSCCTSCQTEFWLGRRKHHCRSCGQIFCADCSEFWAPLPDEKLFSPVRLCGPCYHSVTSRMSLMQLQQTYTKTATTTVSSAVVTQPNVSTVSSAATEAALPATTTTKA